MCGSSRGQRLRTRRRKLLSQLENKKNSIATLVFVCSYSLNFRFAMAQTAVRRVEVNQPPGLDSGERSTHEPASFSSVQSRNGSGVPASAQASTDLLLGSNRCTDLAVIRDGTIQRRRVMSPNRSFIGIDVVEPPRITLDGCPWCKLQLTAYDRKEVCARCQSLCHRHCVVFKDMYNVCFRCVEMAEARNNFSRHQQLQES